MFTHSLSMVLDPLVLCGTLYAVNESSSSFIDTSLLSQEEVDIFEMQVNPLRENLEMYM